MDILSPTVPNALEDSVDSFGGQGGEPGSVEDAHEQANVAVVPLGGSRWVNKMLFKSEEAPA